jgi:thymidylate synthase (FAD)
MNFNIRFIGITQPLIEEIKTADEFIAYTARVSNPSNQMNALTAPRLISYCIRNGHWSVFEQVSCTAEIETTRDIGRQILRHRSFSFQEFSQRYADPTKHLGFVSREFRLQDNANRQNSVPVDKDSDKWKHLVAEWENLQTAVKFEAAHAYKWAIDHGIAKEQARVVLPEGLTITRMYMAGTLRSWLTLISVREKEGTQKEHRDIALACKMEICKYFPTIEAALGKDNEWKI